MQDLQYFKQKLFNLKDEITIRINAIDKDIRHEDLSADWTEQASERENDEILESLGNASEKELEMINNALNRIDLGIYFSCQSCGEKIPTARLDSLPFTSYCVSCAEELT